MKHTAIVMTAVTAGALALGGCGVGQMVGWSDGRMVGWSDDKAIRPSDDETISPTDYTDAANWVSRPDPVKFVDTIYFYPTVVNDPKKPAVIPLDDPDLRAGAARLYHQQASVFEESTNVFVPVYRQSNLAALAADGGTGNLEETLKHEQQADAFAALDWYFEHANGGRPYILAGHSQGAAIVRLVLKEYLAAHPEVRGRMVAAYPIGYSVTRQDLAAHPWMKFAERVDDTGVVVSWNTEGPGNRGRHNAVVLEGGISINPINWRRDAVPATAAENLGSRVWNAEKGAYEFLRDYADATVDAERGVVLCTTGRPQSIADSHPEMVGIFGPESYHGGDYDLYYLNLRENVARRIRAWMEE